MKPTDQLPPEHPPHWDAVLSLVHDAHNDEQLLHTLRYGVLEELESIYQAYGITHEDLDLVRQDLALFETVGAFGKWFY